MCIVFFSRVLLFYNDSIYNDQTMNHRGFSKDIKQKLGLRIGPFIYQFRAYDHWGLQVLKQIELHLAVADLQDNDRIDRYIHLVDIIDKQNPNTLPLQLKGLLTAEEHDLKWSLLSNQVNTLRYAKDSAHTFWTTATGSGLDKLRFDFPWRILINDIVDRGGGLLHTGLASYREAGLLFLAPPGGGKTTTLSTAPSDWQVLSDDAALVWPDGEKCWLASPLPAWGRITNPNEKWRYPHMALDQSCRLKSILVLQKTRKVSLKKYQASTAMPFIYRALCEYPVTILTGAIQEEPFFRTAAAMTRDLTCWELSLPLHGDIWPLLSREAA